MGWYLMMNLFTLDVCAHILNLIVSDALKDLHVSIIRIRNVMKYDRPSPARLQIFKDFAKENKI